MTTKDNFKGQFSTLTQKEKITYAQKLLITTDAATDILTFALNDCFTSLSELKQKGDIESYEKLNKTLFETQKQDCDFVKSKIRNLHLLRYADLSNIKAITPDMENGICSFVEDFLEKRFILPEKADSLLHKGIFETSFKIEDKQHISTENIIKKAEQEYNDGVANIRQKYKNLFK